jgi:parvulin-like peptidyl-prolyl isomerase
MSVTLKEKMRYYEEHFEDFDRPAQVVWREIAVDAAKSASRDEARRKAEALLARVSKGEDFAGVARAESQGATARDGGKWETAPGSYAVPGVNEAIEALGPGGISRVIEAPAGFHIVKVESKRAAGPAPFNEVQDKVRDLVARAKQAKLASAFIDDLKAKTLITTMFDKAPTGDPSAIRAGAEMRSPR